MKRQTLIKYTNQSLLERIKRLCRMGEHLAKKDKEKNEIEINNVEGIILDRMIEITNP